MNESDGGKGAHARGGSGARRRPGRHCAPAQCADQAWTDAFGCTRGSALILPPSCTTCACLAVSTCSKLVSRRACKASAVQPAAAAPRRLTGAPRAAGRGRQGGEGVCGGRHGAGPGVHGQPGVQDRAGPHPGQPEEGPHQVDQVRQGAAGCGAARFLAAASAQSLAACV